MVLLFWYFQSGYQRNIVQPAHPKGLERENDNASTCFKHTLKEGLPFVLAFFTSHEWSGLET